MKGYLIARVDIKDFDKYRKYLNAISQIIEIHEGKAIVRAGKSETLEGTEENRRIVILEFPSIQKAREFYYSKEYQIAKKIRQDAAEGDLLLIEGI